MNKNKVLVLYYHRINSLNTDTNLLAVSPSRFRQHMKYIKRNYVIPRFEENWNLLDGNGVVITFDDGYLDIYENALPILEELEIPATVFVTTGTMDQKRELWWDELEYLLLTGDNLPQKFHLQDERFEYTWPLTTYEMRLNCYYSIHFLMKNCIGIEKRNRWFDQLWEWRQESPAARKTHLTLNDSACIELAKSKLITIGAHTISHPALAKLPVKEQEREIKTSVEYLSNLLGRKTDTFSYPFGAVKIDYNQDTIAACKEAGIRKAAATTKGLWTKQTDNYEIPRICIQNINLYEFENRIESMWKEWE